MSKYFIPLTRDEIITSVESKKPGVFGRKATWIFDEFLVGSNTITIVKTWNCRLNINPSHMKSTRERKAREDAEIGATKARKPSSYIRLKDEDGNLIDPFCIVRDRKTGTKQFLQLCVPINGLKKPIIQIYKNGENFEFDDKKTEDIIIKDKVKEKLLKKKKKDAQIETWVLPINKILKIN